jgi:hypothetical protein
MAENYTRRITLYINDKEVKNNIGSIQKEFNKANNALKGMELGSEEYMKQMAKIAGLKSILNDHNAALRETANQSVGMLDKLNNSLGKVGLSLPAIGWGAAIAAAGAAAKAIVGFVNETMKMRTQVGNLTGETGQNLADLTANIKATADTFEVSFDEVAVASNNFAQNMDITNESANKLINQGFINGANASGEFLAMLSEYGPQLKEAGYSAEEAISMMSMQVKEGVFTDKGIDVIKEASIRLREMPKSTRDALDAIGISSGEMMQKLSSGQISVSDAIKQVSQKMATLPPQSSEVGTAIADIFGGPGEDAGLAYIKLLGTAQLSMQGLEEKTLSQMSTQELVLKSNQDLNKAFSDLIGIGTGGFDRITASAKILLADGITGLITGFKTVRDWFIDVYNNALPLRGYIQALGMTFKNMFAIVMLPLKEIWNSFTGLGKVMGAIVSGNFKDIPKIIGETYKKAGTIAVDTVNKIGDNVKNAWDKTLNGKLELNVESNSEKTQEQTEAEIKAAEEIKVEKIKIAQQAADEEKKKLEKAADEKQKLDDARADAAIAASEREYERKRMLIEENVLNEIEKNKQLEALEIAKSADTVKMLENRLANEKHTAVEEVKLKEEIEKEKFQLEQIQSKLRIKSKKMDFDNELSELEISLGDQNSLIEQKAIEENLSDSEKKELLLTKEIEFLNNKKALYVKNGLEIIEIDGAIVKKTSELAINALDGEAERQKEILDLKKKYEEEEVANKEQKDLKLKEIDRITQNGALVSHEEYERMKSIITEKYEKKRYETIQKYLEDEMAEVIIKASVVEGDTISVGFEKKTEAETKLSGPAFKGFFAAHGLNKIKF